MNQTRQSNADLPAPVRKGLERFCNQLHQALGDHLDCIILYGGLAKNDQYDPRTSNVNVLVVVKAVTVETLDKIASPIRKGVRDFHLAVMILSEDDLRSSTDVFPIKFLDMREHHRVLWGKDVLADLPIATDHIRLRCEQEIKNLLLRLRSFYVRGIHRPSLVQRTLTSSVSVFLNSLRALLMLKTGEAPVLKAAVAEKATEDLELDGESLQTILALKSGKIRPKTAEVKQLYDSLMVTVQKAAKIIDQL